jgi:large subunit ribosomal protein L35
MTKLKTKKSAAKRFKVTKTKKIMQGHSLTSHLQAHKSKSRRRRQDEPRQVSPTNEKKLKTMLPFGD